MYAQLGKTLFDGLTSFVSFSSEEEAIIVEHALINRKPKLQGAGLGLKNLSITIFLHAEFCNVKNEIAAFRVSKDSYEILPLLWGDGTLEGSFVIVSMSVKNEQMDNEGNLYAATVNLSLKESVADNTAPPPSGFATGNKQPVTKSKRTNPSSCASQISKVLSDINCMAKQLDNDCRSYTGQLPVYTDMDRVLTVIKNRCNTLLSAVANASSCIYGNNLVVADCNGILSSIPSLISNANNAMVPGIGQSHYIALVKGNNITIQNYVKDLNTTLSSITKTAALKG